MEKKSITSRVTSTWLRWIGISPSNNTPADGAGREAASITATAAQKQSALEDEKIDPTTDAIGANQIDNKSATEKLPMSHLGCYGALRQEADFFNYNLPEGFVTVWSDWVENLQAAGVKEFGEDWNDMYTSSDGYRFVLSAGIAGAQAWAGIVQPSQNSKGSPYPFCLAASYPSHLSVLEALTGLEQWFVQMELLGKNIAAMEQENLDLEKIAEQIKSSAADSFVTVPPQSNNQFIPVTSMHEGGVCIRIDSDKALYGQQEDWRKIADTVLSETLFQYSAWVSADNLQSRGSRTLLCGGMPTGSLALGLGCRQVKQLEVNSVAHGDALLDESGLVSSSNNVSIPDVSDVAERTNTLAD